jgi:hypothetical protein|tara:strand:+ start:434 stop:703 length:270 start_codon:yes stop_codon:yes gene_type:complete
MTVVKGNFGNGGQGGGPPTLDNVDLTHAKTIECEKCKCKAFKQTMMLKKLSPLLSPTGQEAIVPIMVFACEGCGHVNEEFQDAEIKPGG